ncbi:PilZ domain-containing protein [Novosphingobium sp. PY1]|uniref:PilZ domain-containing protein n=1 Tax=Novosphingobium sp. PY1 TaxID=1882221 RepID=UPI001A8DCBEF|nr:PilZ domain-containing protein [Novosphingobium sp. PY1]GFM28695.1 uncharacterized protein PY1_contig-05-89 [Novosphingobium sp. PY1]
MDEREHERFIIDREVECFVGERRHEVFVYDLSAGGCMIEAPHLELEGGTLIHLRLNHFIEAQGRIVWLAKGHAGVRFDWRLAEVEVRHLGFTPRQEPFETIAPCDRLGRPLPAYKQY